jgi:prepilin-type N-terminal cleavage/methylation domain-containing protein
MLAEMNMRRPFPTIRHRRAGLTLIEILVALGVLGILVALAVPSMSDLLERRRVIAAADELVSLLNYAKAETTALDKQLAVHTESDPGYPMSCAAVTTSGPLDSNCKCYYPVDNMCPGSPLKALRAFQLPLDHVQFTAHATWSNANNADQFIFSRVHQELIGASDYYLDVVSVKRGFKLQVQVNTAGRIRVCSPNGDMSGYPRCA